ncbi:2-methylcitrate dehydratase PrpD [Sporobacter termitidis DSM 10068]|uniref:2-methylcitrate dehydratase PrpD n=1 Tax=Sporobacter termitidis DSM 10068 TaxID=1123282 RepID=A0A1M5YKW2_9FIRM|nr:MmgE/PrpD family protein [Sporobacter termitidis]SHI12632.1 2-methylcitrate dehydratase PrpD [Sporobacter termitidis DSM 10068]
MDASSLFARNFLDVTYEDLPQKVVDETKKQVLDLIGVAAGGYGQAGAREVRELAVEWGGAPQATIFGCGAKVPAPNAAQANATMVHSLDFDDVHEAAVMHPGVVTIPTSLAVAEYMGGLSGRDFIRAVAVGGDMISRMGLATRPGDDIHQYGWHFTTLNGFMTAAAVAGWIMGLDEERLVSAIGIGYHQSCGNGQAVKDGVLTKRLGPGFAVRGGIQAAMLAQKGVTGARNALEGVQGYYKVYHGGCYSQEILTGGLGKRFESENISIKPYPCCRGTHPTIDATLVLVREHDIAVEEVDHIKIWAGKGTLGLLALPLEVKARPRNFVDSQFSLVWGCAAAIAKKRVTLSCYTEAAIKDPEILAAAAKVAVEHEPKFDTGGLEPVYIEITMKDGTVYKKLMETATGSPEKPAAFDEVVNKFHGCVESSARPMPKAHAEKIIDTVQGLEKLGDIRELIALLVW